MSFNVPNNLLFRQDHAMHKTNGSWAAREVYEGDDLTTINALVAAVGIDNRLPLGVMYISCSYRFAGRKNPLITAPVTYYSDGGSTKVSSDDSGVLVTRY